MTDSSGGQFVPIHGADDPSGFGSREATATRVINPSTVAYDLISIRCLAEMEDRVLEILRDATVACWIALYRSVDGAYRRRRVQGIGEDALPDRLDPDATSRLLDEGFDITVEECAQLDDRFPGPIGCIRMQAEFDLLPSFVIVGRSAGAGGPLQTDLQTIVEVCAIALHNAELVERLQAEVFIDYLTKCYNRRAFEEHLAVEMVRARRYERSLCLLLLDLDNFKRVNDAQGHPQGDYVLRKLGEMLRGAFRTTDRVCRFGGDEFAVVFPETAKEDVVRLADRLRRQIEDAFPDEVVQTGVTASIGIACYPGDTAREDDLIRAADRALYRAKAEGRNCVVGL
jgi:diguanylate cyclase (GGDEF)-like protein